MTKIIFITGASSGIGEATARQLVEDGHKVALCARNWKKLSHLVEELGSDNSLAVPADVTDIEALKSAVNETLQHYGRLDVVFANAGKGLNKPGIENGDPEEWDHMVDLNIKALLFTANLTLPHLRKTTGHFILTASAAGHAHMKGSVYGASKWFAHAFGMNLAEEMKQWQGRCTTISPGMVNTPFFDQPKEDKLQPQDVADAVSYAISANPRNSVREVYLMPAY